MLMSHFAGSETNEALFPGGLCLIFDLLLSKR